MSGYVAALTAAMDAAGLSQNKLAAKAKVDRPYLQKALAGIVPPHVAAKVKLIERALRIKDGRLQIAAAVDRGEIDVSHLSRAERERIARMVFGAPKPAPVAEAFDQREVEEIETSEAMRPKPFLGVPREAPKMARKTVARKRRTERLAAGLCRECDTPRHVDGNGKMSAQWCEKHLLRQRRSDAASWNRRH